MAKDHQVAVRINDRTHTAVQEFAEEYDLNQAEAVRRMIEARLAGEGYLSGPAVADGGIAQQVDERLDELEQQQQNRLNEIDQKVGEVLEEPSTLEKWVSGMVVWSGGLTLAGVVAWIVSASGLVASIKPELALWTAGLATLFLVLFSGVQKVIE